MGRHIWVVEYADRTGSRSHIWQSKGLNNTFRTQKAAKRDAYVNNGQSREFNWDLKFRVVKYIPDDPYVRYSGGY